MSDVIINISDTFYEPFTLSDEEMGMLFVAAKKYNDVATQNMGSSSFYFHISCDVTAANSRVLKHVFKHDVQKHGVGINIQTYDGKYISKGVIVRGYTFKCTKQEAGGDWPTVHLK